MKLRIATRRSALALTQTRWVAARLQEAQPDLEADLIEVVTEGDRIQDRPLSAIGGKGLFVSEVEARVLAGDAELAVHSMKDLPSELAEGLHVSAVPLREDPRDVLVTADGCQLDDLPAGARVGTSSLRRSVQLGIQRADLAYTMIRGNVDTRLARLDAGDFDAIVLAYAGLKRLGLADRPLWPLPLELSIPAVGQGALALECRVDDDATNRLLSSIEDRDSRICVSAERAFLIGLGGDCNTPLAAHARLEAEGSRLRFDAMVGAVDDQPHLHSTSEQYVDYADPDLQRQVERLGRETARQLLDQGARALIDAARQQAARDQA